MQSSHWRPRRSSRYKGTKKRHKSAGKRKMTTRKSRIGACQREGKFFIGYKELGMRHKAAKKSDQEEPDKLGGKITVAWTKTKETIESVRVPNEEPQSWSLMAPAT